ncbi:hypothetical protein CAPTEDRAFT_214558 [Capitella teleta]|uniref:Neurotransmitter-gated ion-channel ligand-binding domain-containing protein n=1 Tax=Capitella teleta TaxID=283909 RepID=R7TAY9_CAPTE|nr:hypothetical protein CAPTEDRAFT_214558 [Capitella teleta]|eukprot:ELT90893.1 hypothetical protein CAPTEDRAFT_214558 [Capitella teleta]
MLPMSVITAGIACLCLANVALGGTGADLPPSNEGLLVKTLLGAYKERGTEARPLQNSSERVTVNFGMRLITLDLDDAEQTMKTSVWLRITWNDPYMTWDPSEYGGQRYIAIPSDKIWTPDIYNVNTAVATMKSRTTMVSVKYTGFMFWTPHHEFIVGCVIDAKAYPFDEHTCSMWFQQVADKSTSFDLQPYHNSPLDLSTSLQNFRQAQGWDVSNNKTEWVEEPKLHNTILVFSGRPSLKFSLTAKRRPTFQAYLLLVPCIVLPLIASLSFTFPFERPDRISLIMSLFGAYVILLLLLTSTVPPSPASIPNLCECEVKYQYLFDVFESPGLYYSVDLGMIPLCIMLTSLVVNVIIQKLGFILCLRSEINEYKPGHQTKELSLPEDATFGFAASKVSFHTQHTDDKLAHLCEGS